jgi:5-methylcytosine-specific restriction endonuclease McrA
MAERVHYFRPPGLAGARAAYESAAPRQADKNFYSSARWRRLRAAYLAEHPLCEDCLTKGRTTAAAHVHHREPRKLRPDLAFEWDNLKATCQPCHNAMEER